MARSAFKPSRRTLLVGAGALCAAGATGIWAWSSSDPGPLTALPAGWYLLSQPGSSDGERQLVVRHTQHFTEHVLETEFGARYLSAAISPDARTVALLKRVPRGSMPTDAIALYDTTTFQRMAVVEYQVAFQRIPTFYIGWAADRSQLTVSYNLAGRTLLFRIRGDRRLSIQAMVERASFQFHPLRKDIALYTASPSAPDQIHIIQLVGDMQEQEIEAFVGSDPLWSPDGTRLAYRDRLGAKRAQRLLIRDEATRQHTALLVDVERLAWSADSRRLAVYGSVDTDPLNLRTLLPANVLSNWQQTNQPRLFIYDIVHARMRSIDLLRSGFQLAHLQWINPDWLLVMDVKADQSFLIDRRGEQRIPVTELDSYTPLIRWLPQSQIA